MPSVTPTDQVCSVNAPGGTGTHTDTAQADPITGTCNNVQLIVDWTATNDGGSTTLSYTLDGAAFTAIRAVGDTGGFPENHVDTANVGNVDTTLLAIRISGFAGPGFDANANVNSWSVRFSLTSGIIEG